MPGAGIHLLLVALAPKLFQNVTRKEKQKIWAYSVIFEKQPRASNRPLGENSPSLVTLGSMS
jgi:hypothetical protein